MKQNLFLVLSLFACITTYSQAINVNTTTYTVPQLIEDVLFAPSTGSAACVGTIANITWSTGNTGVNTSHNGIGYFTNNNPNFPLTSGVILSSGNVMETAGPNSSDLGNLLDDEWPGDQELLDYMQGLGLNVTNYNDATIIEFDFTPLTTTMSFDFLFASEEYGLYQCDFSDAFAFFLTNVTANEPTTNLALVPNTTIPVSVVTIKDEQYYTGAGVNCGSTNPDFFGNFNGGANAGSSATNFNGETIMMTATSTVIPNNVYHIKLVVADRNDNYFDSAVFLSGGSFDIGTPEISGTGTEFEGISEFTGANAVCGSKIIVVKAGSATIPGANYAWTLNNNPVGTNSYTHTVIQEGIYAVTITYPGGCQQTDTMIFNYLVNSIILGSPSDITLCSNPFNLSDRTSVIANGSTSPVMYHNTLVQAQEQSLPITSITSYNGVDGEIIYASVEDSSTGCILTTQFALQIDPSLCAIAGTPPDMIQYETTINSQISTFDFTINQTGIIYGNNNPSDYTVTYYRSSFDANTGADPILNTSSFNNTINPQQIYAVLRENSNSINFSVVSFQLIIIALPTVSISGPGTVCTGNSATIIFSGTPGATVNYTVDGNPRQLVLNALGTFDDFIPSVLTNTVYTLVSVTITTLAGTTTQPKSDSITVNVTSPPTIITPTNYILCDDSLNNNGISCFDLNTKISEINGGNSNIIVSFYETNTSTSAIPLTTNYCNIALGNQQIFVRAHNIGSPLCFSTTSFFLIVNPVPLPNAVITDYELCDISGLVNQEIFDLSTKTAEIANSQSGVTIRYYDSLLNAQSQTNVLPNLYTNTSNPQQIWINIKDDVTGCNTTSSFNVIVNLLPVAFTPPTIFECSNGLVLTALFDLTVNENTVKGGVPGLTVSYYNTFFNADNEISPIIGSTTYFGFDTEIVFIRLENDATGCYATTTQLLRVTQGPIANTPQPLQYCDPNNDGLGIFNLNDATNEIAGVIVPPGVSVSYHETQDDAFIGSNPISLATPYPTLDDSGSQLIYVRVFYTLTGCANYVTLQLLVNPTPEATAPAPYELCDYTGQAGFESFNLTSKISEILAGIDPALTTVTFYDNLPNAQGRINPITNVSAYQNSIINAQTLYVRVETNATGCFDIVELDLIVNPLPNATQPNYPQYSLCDVDQTRIGFEVFDLGSKITPILLGQQGMNVTFYISLGDAQNGTNEITSLFYENQIPFVQTLGIRVTNSVTGCFVISTMDIRVEPLPTPIPLTQPYIICDDNQDGISCGFALSSLESDILQGANYTLSFYETLTDAQTGNTITDIDPTQPYCTINPFVQLLYVRAVDNLSGCFNVMPIELNVNPSPVAPVLLNAIVECDDDANTQNASTAIDLTQRTPNILAQQPLAASNYTVTYFTTAALAQNGTAPIIPATNYIGTDGQTIWVRVENNTSDCFNIGSFTLKINIPLLLITPAPLSICDDDLAPNNEFHEFDLTVKNTEINQGTGYVVTYYPTLALAQAGVAATAIQTPTAYINVNPAVQTLGVIVTTADGCKSNTTLNIRVLPIPTPRTNPPALTPKCDDNNPGDMLEIFNLTTNASFIINGDPNLSLHYFGTRADAENNVVANEILIPTAYLTGQSVFIRVENTQVDYLGNKCYVVVEQALSVNPLPSVVQPLASYRVCDTNTDGLAAFDMTNPDLALQILGLTQLPANFTISYYLTAAGANPATIPAETPLPSSYTNVTPDAQNIYIRIVNNVTGCVNATGVLTLAVEEQALATGPQNFAGCDNYNDLFDGILLIDLTQYATAILAGQDAALFLVSYYTSQADVVAGTNALSIAESQAYETTAYTDTIWVKVENSSNSIVPLCFAITTINIKVEGNPNPIITTANGENTICVDFNSNIVVRNLTLNSGITNAADYTFAWFEDLSTTPIQGATGPTYTVNEVSVTPDTPRNYTVNVTSINPPLLGCSTTSAAFEVLQSGQAFIPLGTTGFTVTNAFDSSQTITVTVQGFGTYEYSLDDGPRQVSNIFESVSLGTHLIRVWDTEDSAGYNCEELVINEVQVIDYPYFFTPNGDGIHDTWNIVGLGGQANAKIYIFDRYGKLLKQISTQGNGWDGTYNGQLLPSDDYWFTVDFTEQNVTKQFKAHFTLKR